MKNDPLTKQPPHPKSEAVDTRVRELTEVLVRAAQPDRVILFGSHARGEAGPDSDLDLLIVQSCEAAAGRTRWQELRRLREVLRPFRIAKDFLLYRPEEFAFWRGSLNHVVGRAVREGIVLYERS